MGEKDSSTAADQVVVTVAQITPVPWIEVHCHGGAEVVRWLTKILEGQGCQPCSWSELERATTTDPLKTAAMLEMVQASTVRTAGILLDQYNGAFDRALTEIHSALAKNNLDETIRLLESLARHADVGRHLTTPWKVAVIGPPNVGKSSLVNALAGFQRSIVAPTPGTTRDLVTTSIAVDGWPVELIDTAGLRSEAENLEGQGIGLARQAATDAALCLWILDASEPPIWSGDQIGSGSRTSESSRTRESSDRSPTTSATAFTRHARVRPIVNKIDLPPAWDFQQSQALAVSAKTGAGIPNLVEALAGWLVPDPPPSGTAVPFKSSLVLQIEEALAHARSGRVQEVSQILQKLANERG
jgi:tRNA modification GTPase